MRKFIDNFLTSGHQFAAEKNLQKFRFAFLNSSMLLAFLFSFLNCLVSVLGFIDFGRVFETAVFLNFLLGFSAIYCLRKDKKYYLLVVYFCIISSLALFYFVLFTRQEDEFRLIAFFLAVFITYVLLGKNIGMRLALLILVSIIIISQNYDLKLSSFAFSTFFSFFIIFTGFLYFFLKKVEKDSIEFERLNNMLKNKVSEEKRQREEQEQMLLKQCRMANMGAMLNSIAHQWRQPLMCINSILMNMGSALESRKQDKEAYLEYKIDEVASLTAHMSQTIEDFRGLFKAENKLTRFSLSNAIDDVLTLIKNNLTEIELHFNSEKEHMIYAQYGELTQVIIILLSNAVEVLNLRNKSTDKQIKIDIGTVDDKVYISIEDNAGGVSPENMDTIFDPYFTTKKQSGGTGLGLYIARIIVEDKMKGNITVANTGNGAKFTVAFTSRRADAQKS